MLQEETEIMNYYGKVIYVKRIDAYRHYGIVVGFDEVIHFIAV